MTNKDYNGWTNYVTWRIMLEVWDGYDTDTEVDHNFVQDQTEELLNPEEKQGLVYDYANAFMSDVNWHEIANAINERNDIEIEE